jgi:hypothetical protein
VCGLLTSACVSTCRRGNALGHCVTAAVLCMYEHVQMPKRVGSLCDGTSKPKMHSIRKGGTSSSRLRMLGSERKVAHIPGRAPLKKVTLSRRGVDEYRRRGKEALREHLNGRFEQAGWGRILNKCDSHGR